MKKWLFSMVLVTIFALCSIGYAQEVYDAAEQNYAQKLLELVNGERAKVGRTPLFLAEELLLGAATRAEELAKKFSHVRPNGTYGYTIISNPKGGTVAELIAAGQKSPEEALAYWLKDPDYSISIHDAWIHELGVGYYYKQKSKAKHYWVLLVRD